MFSKAILLFIIVPLSLATDMPLVQILPEDRFSASSSYNESVRAPNVRFPSEQYSSSSKEPWCPASRADLDYSKEYVTVVFGCPQTVRIVEGKDRYTLYYSVEYSNDQKKWKTLTSKERTHYDPTFKMFKANEMAEIKPPVKARYFRFRIRSFEFEFQPCIKVEMYGSSACEPENPEEPVIPVKPENPVEPIGCFSEKAKKRLMPNDYYTVTSRVEKKCPSILAVYEECKQKAAEQSLEIFGIWNMKKCVTTKTGKFDEYFNEGPKSSRNCITCQDKGIGSKKTVFVYKK